MQTAQDQPTVSNHQEVTVNETVTITCNCCREKAEQNPKARLFIPKWTGMFVLNINNTSVTYTYYYSNGTR
jgi:hypothetical protein